MKKTNAIIIIIFCGLLAIGGAGLLISKERAKFSNGDQVEDLVPVIISSVAIKDFKEVLTYHSTLTAKAQVYVIPKVPGRVEQVQVQVGDKVNREDLLVRLETEELELHRKQAEAGVAVAEAQVQKAITGARPEEIEQTLANLDQAKASYENILLNLERASKLHKEGLMSGQEWDGLNAQFSVAQAQLNLAEKSVELVKQGAREEDIAMAKASLSQAIAAYELASLALNNAAIKAPISGVVSQVLTEEGSLVGTGSPVINIVDSSVLKLPVMVSEHEVVKIFPGQTVSVKVNALPNLEVKGTVTTVSPMGDPVGGLFPVTIEVPNPDGLLKPGMYSTVSIEIAKQEQALAIPSKAVIQSDSSPRVYLVKDGVAQLVTVALGIRSEAYVQITDGIKENDLVVVTGQSRLNPGTGIKVMGTEEEI